MLPQVILPEDFKETELGPIPVEWEVVRLIDTAALTRKPRGINLSDYEAIPFIPMELVPDNGTFIEHYELRPGSDIRSGTYCETGDILLAKITPSFENGKQGIVGELPLDFAYATTEVYPIQARPDCLDQVFLFHFLRLSNVRADIAGKMEGSTGRQRVPKAVIENYPIPLPPLPEQRRIAHVLSTIQRAIAAQDDLIAAAREVKRSLMQRLFTYGPGAEPAPTKETEIGEIPEHWEVVRLDDVAIAKYGKAKPKTEGNVPVVGSGGTYYWTDQALIDYPTLVIGRKGTAGRVWLLEIPCWPADTTFYLEWKKQVDIKFLFGYLTLNPLSGEHAKTTLPSLQRPELERCPIPFPPIPEQQEIARILSAADRKIEAEEQRKAALQALFKTMLHQLMTGQVRLRDVEFEG